MGRIAALLMLFLLQAPTARQGSRQGSIEGVVVKADSGEPVSGAQVTLAPLGPGGSVPQMPGTAMSEAAVIAGAPGGAVGGAPGAVVRIPESPAPLGAVPVPGNFSPGLPGGLPPVTTGADGRFVFPNLAPGGYRLFAAANGYMRQEFGQKVPNSQGTPIFVAADQSLRDVPIRMLPTGSVSGRVFDESGQPAQGAPVQLLRYSYGPQGRQVQPVGVTGVNDRGEYRLFGITPGRYYLLVGSAPGPARPVPGAAGNAQAAAMLYRQTFYPGVADIDQAGIIEIRPGVELALDLRTELEQTWRIRGTVIDSATGQPPPAVQVTVSYRSFNSGGSFSQLRAYDPAAGTFEVQNVKPGSYTIQAAVQPSAAAGPQTAGAVRDRVAGEAARSMASAPVVVTRGDVENVRLTLIPPFTVAGRLSVDGQPISALSNVDRVRISLRPAEPLGIPGGVSSPQPPAADGTFRVDGIRPGDYALNVTGLPANFYVKSARYGGSDVLGASLTVSEGGAGALDIVVRAGAAELSGTVGDASGRAVPAVQVVLIPSDTARRDLFRVAVADQGGRFRLTGITPGNYRLFSWEAIEQNAFWDPAVVKQYEAQGRAVNVAEGAVGNVDVRIIPMP